MKYIHLIVLCLIWVISLNSCRKKDQKYEGIYIGQERHSMHDSSGTIYSLDTTYYQEFHVEYSRTKKTYSVTKLYDPNMGMSTIHKNDIINHVHIPFGEGWSDAEGNIYGSSGYFRFSGDSMYFNSSSSKNWEYTNFEFGGKRN